MSYPNYPPPPQQQPSNGYFQQSQQPAYPPQQPAYPPPQYQQQQQFAPPPPVQHQNLSIDDFYDQPAASGKSIASWFQTPGQSITGIVARPISKADLRPQTDMQTKRPKHFSDGRPMITMTIPLQVQPSPDFPDGRAAWIISSSDREDLDVAMQAAGCQPRTVPEAGAIITVTFLGFKQIPGFGAPKKVKQISYQRPQGASQAPAEQAPFEAGPAPSAPLPTAPAPNGNGNGHATMGEAYAQTPQYQQALAGVQNYQPPVPPAYAGIPDPNYQTQQYAPPPVEYAAAQQAAPAPPPATPPAQPAPTQWAAPSDLTAEQQERLRQLTGN